MNRALATTSVAYALGLAVWAAARAARGRGIGRNQVAGAIVLEIALAAQALVALAAWAAGRGPAQPGAAAGYLVASVVILPAAVGYGRRGGTRWDSLVFCVAGIAMAAIVLRLQATWTESA